MPELDDLLGGLVERVKWLEDAYTVLSLQETQDVGVGSSPTFTALTLSGLTAGRVVYTGTGGLLSVDAGFTYNAATDTATLLGGLAAASVTDSGLTSGRVVLAGVGGLLGDDADLAFDGTQLGLATQGSTGGILVGGDVQWYRGGANTWRTPDTVTIDSGLNVGPETFAGVGQVFAVSASAPTARLRLSDAATNVASLALSLDHLTSGTPAAGFGVILGHFLHSDSNSRRAVADWQTTWATATDATRKARTSLLVYDTAAREAIRMEASGAAPMIGFLGAAAVVKQATITQTYSTTSLTLANDTSANFPAGGTGTAAGGWDTAANRDLAITRFNALRVDVDNVKNVLNTVIDSLQAYGLNG